MNDASSVLLIGFEPFAGERVNPSREIVRDGLPLTAVDSRVER